LTESPDWYDAILKGTNNGFANGNRCEFVDGLNDGVMKTIGGWHAPNLRNIFCNPAEGELCGRRWSPELAVAGDHKFSGECEGFIRL
jgi:hypothetical protein